eukprot:1152565-Pelagomonas_calceolata.AAC.9
MALHQKGSPLLSKTISSCSNIVAKFKTSIIINDESMNAVLHAPISKCVMILTSNRAPEELPRHGLHEHSRTLLNRDHAGAHAMLCCRALYIFVIFFFQRKSIPEITIQTCTTSQEHED